MTKPSYDEFVAASIIIMAYIEDDPNSQQLKYALVDYRYDLMLQREKDETA
tara:strand:+ start:2144 stop:2296 length:153 start_codon:yes stop_codon:yes gene_type:complete